MQVAPLSSALGVELKDFDLSATATAQEQAELRRLFLEHHLLAVRGQSPTPEDQDRFVEIFGPRPARPAEAGAPPRHLRRLALDGWNTGDGVIEWPAPSFKD